MSEYKLVSPLLDGFVMGDPISSHDGIVCCPAMRENSEEKHIVKIISVPASQKQLDALLLTGAYPDAASATDYFKEVAEEIAKDAALLKQLAKLEGFLAYDDWQIVPMEGSRLGYQIYLRSPYKRSLEKYLSRNTMTHLGAVNLGLDLCAALSICRRAGFLHMDLKPSNIFMTGKREFRIGDLGFAKLSALKYTSLPEKYCSSYTPPELHDMLATLNPTTDIYAVGMILYQIYNNGQLPLDGKPQASQLPAPMNADYEMAEIILKACDPNPRKRYQTPIEMGQALVSYMQRNSVSDAPIVPPTVESDFLDAAYEPATQAVETEAAEDSVNAIRESGENGELSFLQELVTDETAPDSDDADVLAEASVSDEVSSMLAQADELMASAEPEAIPEPEPAAPEMHPEAEPNLEEVPAEPELESVETQDSGETSEAFTAPVEESETLPLEPPAVSEDPFPDFGKPRKKHTWLKRIAALIILGLLVFCCYYYYQNYYLIPIDNMELVTVDDRILVKLTTQADTGLLSVTCTDAYGNSSSSPITDGEAVFEDLNPGTLYKVTLKASGFHAIDGINQGTVTTPNLTQILGFSAKTGTEDGSAVLSFTAEGAEQDWILEYSTEGEDTRSVSFTGNSVTVSALTVGKTYTFSLVTDADGEVFISGQTTLEHTAAKNVTAKDLTVLSCLDGVLNVAWSVPGDAAVDGWTVRCYSENGYDETVTVSDTAASFTGISSESAYTVEVTADGMTQNVRTYVSTNPITISELTVDDSAEGKLLISWNSSDRTPEGGWLLMYRMGSVDADLVEECIENQAVIEPVVPGTDYHLTIQAADNSSVFGGTYSYKGKEVASFKNHNLSASDISASLCPTPDKADWTYEDIQDDSYTSTHAIGSRVSMVMYSPDKAYDSSDETEVMFVIRDSEGNVIPELIKTMTAPWRQIWTNGSRYCELDLPIIPNDLGQYTVEIYFNRALVVSKKLNITE